MSLKEENARLMKENKRMERECQFMRDALLDIASMTADQVAKMDNDALIRAAMLGSCQGIALRVLKETGNI